jgi:hypothetical protein
MGGRWNTTLADGDVGGASRLNSQESVVRSRESELTSGLHQYSDIEMYVSKFCHIRTPDSWLQTPHYFPCFSACINFSTT